MRASTFYFLMPGRLNQIAGTERAPDVRLGSHSLTVLRPPLARVTLAFILLASFVLRLVAIDSRGLWGDEAYRVWAARLPTMLDVLHAVWAQPPSAPLYWLALHVWIGLFGHGDVAVRLLSVPAATASVFAVSRLGMLVAGRGVSLLAAALLALSPLAVELGQEATMYAWTMLFATAALVAGLQWLRVGRGLRWYVLAATLLLYTHYMGGLLLIEIFFLGLVWHKWLADPCKPLVAGRARWVAANGLVLLLWLPWLVAMGLRLAERWDELSHVKHYAGLAELYGMATNMSVSASGSVEWSTNRIAAVVAAGGGLFVLALFRNRAAEQRRVWLLALIVLSFIAPIVGVSAVTGAWLVQPRFLALVLPAALVVIAAAVTHTAPSADRLPVLCPLALSLLAVWLVGQGAGLLAFYQNPVHGRDGLRDMAGWVKADVRPGDVVVANQALLLWFLAQYYDGPTQGLPQSVNVREGYRLWSPPDQVEFGAPQLEALSRYAAGAKRIWLIYLPAVDSEMIFLNNVKERYKQVEVRHYQLADLYLFENFVPAGLKQAISGDP